MRKGKFSQPRTPKYQDPVPQRSKPVAPADDETRPIPTLAPDPVSDFFRDLELTDIDTPVPAAAPAAPRPLATDPMLAEGRDASQAMLNPDEEPEDAEPAKPAGLAGLPRKNRRIILVSLCALAVTVLLGVILAVSFLLVGDQDDGRILNNVTVAGVNLGGMTREEAVRVLRAATDRTYTKQDMTVVLPEKTLVFTPAATGAKLDVEAAVEAAYLYGRSGTQAEQEAAKEQSLSGVHHIALLPYLQLNTDYIRQELESCCATFSSAYVPSSAVLTGQMPELEGDRFDAKAPCQTLVLNPGVPGRHLDAQALYDAVLDTYSFNTFRVEITQESLTQDPEPLDLEALLEEYSREPVNASIHGETRAIIPETYGYTFDLDAAQALLDAAKPGEEISIPMEYVEPEYTSESLFGDVLGACETKHTSDENRNTNLRLVCKAIDGMILMPGDLFDYNVVVGERTAAKGYKAAAAYSSGQTVKEIGGGICQVSSTLYLAALRADLEIVDRTEHSYVSTYIPYGMDATVSWGGPEFRFRNNYSHPIRIDAEVSDGYVRINLMSIDERDYYVDVEYNILAWENYETVYEEYAPDNAKGYKDGDVITTPYTGCTVRTYRCRYDKETKELISREEEARSKYKKRDEVIAKIVTAEKPTDPTTDPSTDSTTPPATDPGTAPTDAPTPPPSTDTGDGGGASG